MFGFECGVLDQTQVPPVQHIKKHLFMLKMNTQALHESHHCLHHISLVISEGFDSVENIDDVLLLDHLIDAADATERSRTSSTSPVNKKEDCHHHSTSEIRRSRR